MPGRSTKVTSRSARQVACFFSTVTPGQLPTYPLEPVSSLNSVVLPQFGLPARPIVISAMSCLSELPICYLHGDNC